MASAAEQRAARVADLKRKLAARKGDPAFKKNCEEIRTEITRLEAQAL